MDKEQALEEFLASFKAAVNISFLYTKDHPYFLKPSQELKDKTDNLLQYLTPIVINITPSSIFIDNKEWGKAKLFDDTARIFHTRKIKSIEIKNKVTTEELVSFMSCITLRPQEILRSGGLNKILQGNAVSNISVQELDYSLLLKDEGEEIKDIWVYLFKDALENRNQYKINELATNFVKLVNKSKSEDFLRDKELVENIDQFLAYLKTSYRDKFNNCNKEVLRTILKAKSPLSDAEKDKMKLYAQELNVDVLSEILFEEALADSSLFALNFKLFSQLADQKKHQEIAANFTEKLKKADNKRIRKKIYNIFSSLDDSLISSTYRNALSFFLKDTSFEEKFHFDTQLLYKNYQYILLNLVSEEKVKTKLKRILERVSLELGKIMEDNDWEYIKLLLGVLKKRRIQDPEIIQLFQDIERKIFSSIEELSWQENSSLELGHFIQEIHTSSKDIGYYLDNIFNKEKITPNSIKLFFKFFYNRLDIFYEHLQQKRSNVEFLSRIINNLKLIAPGIALEVYKYLFSFTNEVMQIEIIRAMHDLAEYDEKFLLSILNRESLFLKKEALAVLIKNNLGQDEVIGILLSISSPWGKNNKLILENMRLIGEFGLNKKARPYLELLAKRPFFWNRKIRLKAMELLKIF